MTNQWNVTLDENGALQGEEAYKLFLQGAKAWNAFMKQYPETFVNFKKFKFSNYRESYEIKFSGFQFPKGVSFSQANFGDKTVSFYNANFNSGDISFDKAIFGNGRVSFNNAKFGNGKISFCDVNFGDGDTSFNNTKFGNSNISFSNAVFGNGNVSFKKAIFSGGDISFFKINFGNGNVSFEFAKFSDKLISFERAKLTDGKVSFYKTKFDNHKISFNQADFRNSEVLFENTNFNKGSITFDRVQCRYLDFKGSLFYNSSQEKFKIKFSMERAIISESLLLPSLDFSAFHNVSFRGSLIGALFDIEGSQFAQLPDLTATTLNGHFAVDRIHVESPKNFKDTILIKMVLFLEQFELAKPWDFGKEISTGIQRAKLLNSTKASSFKDIDSTKARRLKELAKKSEDRPTQLDMLAFELSALSAGKKWWAPYRWLNSLYKLVSNYGRSILRPTIALAFVFSSCTIFYANLSNKEDVLTDAAQLSLTQSLPFLSLSRTVAETSLIALYGTEKAKDTIEEKKKATLNKDSLENVGLLQNLLSYICLFFIGLGIRNRFKL